MNDFFALGDNVRGGYHSRVMWRPHARPCNRRGCRSNAGLADCHPRRDSKRPRSHAHANHCRQGSSSGGGQDPSHSNPYSDAGADQTANASAHGHSNRCSDAGADQTANSGTHGYSNRCSDVGTDHTANSGAYGHSNRYSDHTANASAHGYPDAPFPSPRLRERSLA